MLDKVVSARSAFLCVGENLMNDIILVVSWENKILSNGLLEDPVNVDLFLVFRDGDESTDEVKQRISLENFFPKIRGYVAVWIGRVTFSAWITRSVAALIEWAEVGVEAFEFCSHPDFIEVDGEVGEEPSIELEDGFFRIPVFFPLADGALVILIL